MALDRFQTMAPWQDFCEGQVLFDVRNGPPYHAAVVINTDNYDLDDGRGQVGLAHMMRGGLLYNHPLHLLTLSPSVYRGYFGELDVPFYKTVIEYLDRLKGRADSLRIDAEYWLASHGVDEISIPDPDEPRESLPVLRCSCASFVEWCYSQAGTDLVKAGTERAYGFDEVNTLFNPHSRPEEEFRAKIASWGLEGEGPWPILLPASQMRAFQKALEELPHDASEDAASFN